MRKRKSLGIGSLFRVEQLHTFELRRTLFGAASAVVFICALFIPMYPVFKKVVFSLSFLLSAAFVVLDFIHNINRGRILCPELLALLSSVLCFALAGFGDAACVMLFYDVSVIIQSVSLACEQSTAWSPMGTVPERARVSADEGIYNIKASKVRAGDLCVVESGCVIPADGVVVEGMSELELNCFDAEPVTKNVIKGCHVLSGFVNNGETIVIEAEKDYADSFIQSVYADYSKSVNSDTAVERRLSQFFNYFAVVVCAIVVLLCAIIPVFKGEWAQKAFKASALLLVCCPFCISGSVTIATFKAVEKLFSRGAVIKTAGMLGGLSNISELVCNKTGTVTESGYTVTDIQTQGINEKNFLILVSRIECSSDHPIAQAIRDYCGTEKIDHPDNFSATEIEGKGIIADIGGNSFMLGNASLLFENGINCLIPDKNGTAVHLAVNGNYCGYVLLENKTRQSCYDTVETLRALGVRKLTMLSCDLRSIARPVAASLNFDSIKSELTREEKIKSVQYIMENRNRRTSVAYAGNGTDELDVSRRTDISIVTGLPGLGSEMAETDIGILGGGLDAVPGIIKTAKQYSRVSIINSTLGIAARIILFVLALAGVTGPVAVAVVLMLVTAFSCFNTIIMFGK